MWSSSTMYHYPSDGDPPRNPVPFIHVNGEPVEQVRSLHESTATSSPESYGIISSPLLGSDTFDAGSLLIPIDVPDLPQLPSNDVSLGSFPFRNYYEHSETHARMPPRLLTSFSSIGNAQVPLDSNPAHPNNRVQCSTLRSPLPLSLSPHDQPQFPHGDALIDPSQYGTDASPVGSDDFLLVSSDCSHCQVEKERVTLLETKLAEVSKRLKMCEGTIKNQHDVIRGQQLIIAERSKPRTAERKRQNKRRSTSLDDENIASSGSISRALATTVIGTLHGPPKRGRFDPQQRKQTAETRQKGACVRCWKQKQRCEPGEKEGDPCKSCLDSSLTAIRIPCIRTHIVDLKIFRSGTGRNDTWTQRKDVEQITDLTTYISDDRKHLTLSQGFEPRLAVKVRRFRQLRDDVLNYSWRDDQGVLRAFLMPPYALCDIDELTSSIKSYIIKNRDAYIDHFIAETNVPTRQAFRVARKMAAAGKSPLLADTLHLWTAARLIEKPWQICGNETLGLGTDHKWWWIPITPIMDTQLDQIVIKSFLVPMRKQVLCRLQATIEKACRQNWLEILACIVILLNTIEVATQHDHEFATFYNHEYKPGFRRFEDYDLVESYFHSALTLLTHVKVSFEGRLPYLDSSTDVCKLIDACQERHEKDFIIETDGFVADHKKKLEFERIRGRHLYEAPQFWVHQLFLKEWEGKPVTIQEKD